MTWFKSPVIGAGKGQIVSESDSFINEVSEEVRRDKVFAIVRRYGWIAVLAVLALVGGTAWNEYQKGQAAAEAQEVGEALFAALSENDVAGRLTALEGVSTEGPPAAVAALVTAAAAQQAGELESAREALSGLAANPDVPQLYRDLGALKGAMLPGGDATARRQVLTPLSQPGEPFRMLALEQLVYLDLEVGNTDTAIAGLRAILEDAGVTRGLAERAATLLIALGADPVADDASE